MIRMSPSGIFSSYLASFGIVANEISDMTAVHSSIGTFGATHIEETINSKKRIVDLTFDTSGNITKREETGTWLESFGKTKITTEHTFNANNHITATTRTVT